MKGTFKLACIFFLIISLLVIGIVPTLAYSNYYSTRYFTNQNHYYNYYNSGSYGIKYRYYYRNLPTTRPVPQPTQPTRPAQTPATPANPAPSSGLTIDEAKMVNLVNQARISQGIKALSVNSQLVTLARRKSQDMVDNNYFSHTSPTYGSPFDMLKNAAINYKTAGENIAGAPTTESAHQNLMNSAGHRANILNRSFTQIGVGIVSGSIYGKIFTQMFIGL